MGIMTKTLPDLVGRVLEKEKKIKHRIAELESNIEDVKNLVQSKVKQLVEYEISSDEENQKLCRDAIKDHREQIVELQDLLDAYKNELNSFSLSEGELLKIKKAALKVQKERFEKANAVLSQKKQIELQVKELQEKIENLSKEYFRISNDKQEEIEITKILRYIDPLAEKLMYFEKNPFIRTWINDGDTDQHLIMAKLKQKKS